jgi:hypothetical protein
VQGVKCRVQGVGTIGPSAGVVERTMGSVVSSCLKVKDTVLVAGKPLGITRTATSRWMSHLLALRVAG